MHVRKPIPNTGGDFLEKGKNASILFQRITQGFLYLMVTFFLLFCGTQGYHSIQESKFHAFCALCGGYIILMAVIALEGMLTGIVKPLPPRQLLKRSRWSQRFVLLYIVLTWLSALLSAHFPETMLGVSRYEGALTITIYGACFLLVSIYGKCTKGLLWAAAVSIAIFSVLSILQLLGLNPLKLYPEGYSYFDAGTAYSGAYLGTIGNVDLVAAFFSLAIPLLWVLILRRRERRRFLLLIPLLLSLFVAVKMSVMAGVVGVFAGGILSLPLVLPLSKRSRKWAALILAGFFFLLVLLIFLFDSSFELWHECHQLLHGTVDESFGSGRLHIWREVTSRLPQHFLLGKGPDTMLYDNIQPFQKYVAAVQGVLVAQIDMAHNEFLNVLYHQGLLGLLAYLAALLAIAKDWLKHSREDAVTAALGCAAFCYCVQSFFSFSMCITAPFFWLVMALLEKRSASQHVLGG